MLPIVIRDTQKRHLPITDMCATDRVPAEPLTEGAAVRDYMGEVAEDFANAASRWSLKELAGHLNRDERQIARWKSGFERVQLDAVRSFEPLHWRFLEQQMRRGGDVSVNTHGTDVVLVMTRVVLRRRSR